MTNKRYFSFSCMCIAVLLAFCAIAGFFVVNGNVVVAQADSSTTDYYSGNYYDSLDVTLRGDNFRDKLSTLITTTHKTQTSYSGLAEAYKTTDVDPNNSNNVILFYTGKSVKFTGSFSTNINREHVWPKDGGDAFPASSQCGSDAHHLRPCDQQLNSTRGSLSFGEVTDKIAKQNGSTDYNNLCYYSGQFFYPGKGYRGATARILMYVQTRWGTSFNLKFVDGAGHCKTIGDFKTLMKWHLEEPPTDEEIRRNQAVFEIQGNRNPFIDHPEYAAYIYTQSGSYYANNGTKMASEVQALLDNNNPYGQNQNVQPKTIELTPDMFSVSVGETKQIVATVNPSNANKSLSWYTSDSSVATVDSQGVVTAVSEGTVTIEARSKVENSVRGYAFVTVTKARSVIDVVLDGTPNKTVYNHGDVFDPTGLVVLAQYDNGDVEEVALSDCQWLDGVTKQKTLAYGTTTVLCTYKGVQSTDSVIGVTVNKVEKQTLTLTRKSVSAEKSYSWHNWTVDGVSGQVYLYGGTADKMQLNSKQDACAFYNSTPLAGGIKTVTVKLNSTTNGNKSFELFTSTSSLGANKTYSVGSQGKKTTADGTVTWQVNSNDTYFALLYTDKNAVYIDSVTIDFGTEINSPTCQHVAGDWQIETQPTCIKTGLKVKKCTLCGNVVEQMTIDANGHVAGEWQVDKQPTCTDKGLKVQKCTTCGDVVNKQDIAANGHSMPNEWTVTEQPTETEQGTQQRKCANCDHTETQSIPALGSAEKPNPTPDPEPDTDPKPDPDPGTNPNPDNPDKPDTGDKPSDNPADKPDLEFPSNSGSTYPPIGCFGVASPLSMAVAVLVVAPVVFVLSKRKQD